MSAKRKKESDQPELPIEGARPRARGEEARKEIRRRQRQRRDACPRRGRARRHRAQAV